MVVEQLPSDSIFRNPEVKVDEVEVKYSTDKSDPFVLCLIRLPWVNISDGS
jgi:hypothetical protein